MGIVKAMKINSELDFALIVSIKNYTVQKAQMYVAQVNTVNKLDKARLQSLKHERYSDDVVKEMVIDSDIKDKIALKSRPSMLAGELVSYSMLTETIDQKFKIESKKEARDLGNYLGRFFDELIGSFPDEFKNNIVETNKDSIINSNTTFAGYVETVVLITRVDK